MNEETSTQVPTPARKLQDEARAAQDVAQGHAETLSGLLSEDMSKEDRKVMEEWVREGHDLRKEAGKRAVEASLARPDSQEWHQDVHGNLSQDLQPVEAGKNPVAGGGRLAD